MINKFFVITLSVIAAIVLGVRFVSGEDNWICQDGAWVKHGKPVSPMPTKPCPGVKKKEETMKLTSSAFSDNQQMPVKFTCDGENVSPSLTISDLPDGTQSLALIVDDPDAPAGTWNHWLVWNIAPDTKEIAQGQTPVGAVEGVTSFAKVGYGGPCPPSGTHHYIFKLYALDTTLTLATSAKKSDLELATSGHILAQTQLTGLYSRK